MVCVSCAALGQTTSRALSFEVASVKLSTTADRLGTCNGGPGTASPGQYTCSMPVGMFIRTAFDLKTYQFTVDSAGPVFEIVAKIPAGATRQEFNLMLQNLLIERFKLVYHYEKKPGQTYDLTLAKDGPKMTESPDPPGEAAPVKAQGPPKMGPDGFPVMTVPRDYVLPQMHASGRSRLVSSGAGMSKLVEALTRIFKGAPVTDNTGLTGKYAFTLTYQGEGWGPAAAGQEFNEPDILTAIQQQLGLKLEPKKSMFDMFIVDHVERAPIGN